MRGLHAIAAIPLFPPSPRRLLLLPPPPPPRPIYRASYRPPSLQICSKSKDGLPIPDPAAPQALPGAFGVDFRGRRLLRDDKLVPVQVRPKVGRLLLRQRVLVLHGAFRV